jgi:REP element-mobilizing transposase RayT
MDKKSEKQGDFYIYRRHLPHWRARGHLYFLTWRVHKKQDDLTSVEKDQVMSALKHFDGKRYKLVGYVVMNDHVHVLVWPEDEYPLEDIVHSWKSYTAHMLQQECRRKGKIWQDESFDRIVRDEQELYKEMQYILNNPRKRWPEMDEYRWVWCKGMDRM